MAKTVATYVFEDVKKLATAFDGIGQFRSDAYVSFSKSGLSLCTIDKQHVMLIDHVYHVNDMVDASCADSDVGPVSMHFDIKALASTLKLAVKRGNVTLVVQTNGAEKVLKVILEGSEFTVQQAPHDTRLSDADLEPTRDIPAAEITMTGKEAKRIFKELLSFNTDIRIACDPGKRCMVLACDGPNGNATMTVREGWEGVQDLIISSDVSQKFDSKYLQKIIKQDIGNKMITLRLRSGMPIEVCHAVSDHSFLSFHLAPKSS